MQTLRRNYRSLQCIARLSGDWVLATGVTLAGLYIGFKLLGL